MILVALSKIAPSEDVALKAYGVYSGLSGLNSQEVSYTHNENGAPYLKGADNVFVSLSHSGEWVACALSPAPIGIDIQLKKDIDYSRIASRYGFSATDLNSFYAKFTLAEAYAKQNAMALPISLKLGDSIEGRTYSFIKDYALSVTGAGSVFFVTL